MNELGPGNHLPPERDWCWNDLACRTRDAGAAMRAFSHWQKTHGFANHRIKFPSLALPDEDYVWLRPIDQLGLDNTRQMVTRRRLKGMQCKHVPEHMIVSACNDGSWIPGSQLKHGIAVYLDEHLDWHVPYRLLEAKFRQLERRGVITDQGEWVELTR